MYIDDIFESPGEDKIAGIKRKLRLLVDTDIKLVKLLLKNNNYELNYIELAKPEELVDMLFDIIKSNNNIMENLRQWFKEKWVRFGPDGKIRGDCARGDDSEGKPKCLPQAKAHALGKKGRKQAASRKRREDPNPERSGPAINVKTKESLAVIEGTESQYIAARYIDEFADGEHWYVKGTPDVIKKFVLLANSLEDESVKGTEYEPNKGMMAKVHAQLGDDSVPQWTVVKAQNLEQLKPIGNRVLQLLMKPDLSYGVQEFMSELLWTLEEKGLALVTGELQQGVAEGLEQQYLWHGSRQKIPVLEPRQAVDTGGAAGSNQNAIYATSDPIFAIQMGIPAAGSDYGHFPNDPQMVLFSGKIRKGEYVYLHKLPFNGPDGKPQFVQGGNSREFHSIPGVQGIKPIEIKEIPVNRYLNLIRKATPADLKLRKKYMKQGLAEGIELKFHTIELTESQIQPYVKKYFECYNIEQPHSKFINNVKHLGSKKLNESTELNEISSFIQLIQSVDTTGTIKVGDYFSVLEFEINFAWKEIVASGFTDPKEVVDIKMHDNGSINYIKFADGDRYPRLTPARYQGKPIVQTAYFNRAGAADQALTALSLKVPDGWNLDTAAVKQGVAESQQCPECGGMLVEFSQLNEKKDACYYKVKSRYKVWPSAYASGALVKCRKKGAKNWGNKSESVQENKIYFSIPKSLENEQELTESFKLSKDSKGWHLKENQENFKQNYRDALKAFTILT